MTEEHIFERGLGHHAANYQPQTPLTFLEWAASVYAGKTAVVHGEAKALITDREFSGVISEALGKLDRNILVIDVDDPLAVAAN